MPLYLYHDKKSGYTIEVLRSFDEYKEVPRDDELPEDERTKEREWERLIQQPLIVNKWPGSTGPVKGRS